MGAVNTIELIIKGTDNATGVIKGVTDKLESGFKSVGANLTKIGAVGGLAVAPVAAVLKNATDHAVDFDTALTNVQSVLGSTDDETKALGDSILAIGANSKEGPQAAADAFYDIVSGVSDASTHMAILEAAIATSEAGASELKGTTGALVSIMNSYAFAAEDASMVSDVLTRAVGMGVMTMDELAGAIPSVTGLANSMGIGFDDLAGSMAYLTTKGFSAGQAATQLQASMTALLNPNEALKEAFTELGVTSGEALVQQYGMVGALQKIAGTSAATKNGLAKTLGSVEALNGVLALTGEGADEFLEKFQGGMEGATAAAQAIQMGGAQAQMDLLNSAMDTLKITIGQALIPAMTSLVNSVRPIILQVASWAQQNPELIAQIAKVVAIVAALSAGLTIVGGILSAVGTVIGLITTGPIAAIIAAVAALYLAWKENVFGIQEALQPVIDKLSWFFGFFKDNVIGIVNQLKAGDLSGAISHIEYLFRVTLNVLKDDILPGLLAAVMEIAPKILAWIGETAPKVAEKLLQWAQAFIDWVLPFIPPLLAKLGELAQRLITWIGERLPGWVEKLKEWANAFINWIAEVAPPLLVKAGELVGQLITWIGEKAPGVLEKLGDWAQSFIDWVVPAAAGLLEALPGLISDVLKWILDQLPELTAKLLEWGTAFIKWAGDAIPPLIRKLGELLGDLIDWIINDMIPAIVDEIPGIVDAFISFVGEMISIVGPKLLEFLGAIGDFIINDMIPAVLDFGKDIAQGLIDGLVGGIGNLAGELEDAIMELLSDNLPGWAKKALGIESPSKVAAGWGENVILGMMEGLDTGTSPLTLLASILKIVAVMVGAVAGMSVAGSTGGQNFVTSLINAINTNAYLIQTAMGIVTTYGYGLSTTMMTVGNTVGSMLAVGIATGIYNNMSAVIAAVQYMGWTIQSVLKSSLGIYSPSKVFQNFGQNLVAGMALGLGDTAPAMTAMSAFSNDLSREPFALPGGGGASSISISVSVPISADTIRQYPNAGEYGGQVGVSTADRLESELARRGFGVAVNG